MSSTSSSTRRRRNPSSSKSSTPSNSISSPSPSSPVASSSSSEEFNDSHIDDSSSFTISSLVANSAAASASSSRKKRNTLVDKLPSLDTNRNWKLISFDASILKQGASASLTLRERGFSDKVGVLPDVLFSCITYNLQHLTHGFCGANVADMWIARLEVIRMDTGEIIHVPASVVKKGQDPVAPLKFPGIVLLKNQDDDDDSTENVQLCGSSKIRFTSCSFHHSSSPFAIRANYFYIARNDVSDDLYESIQADLFAKRKQAKSVDPSLLFSVIQNKKPVLVLQSAPFVVLARKILESDIERKNKMQELRQRAKEEIKDEEDLEEDIVEQEQEEHPTPAKKRRIGLNCAFLNATKGLEMVQSSLDLLSEAERSTLLNALVVGVLPKLVRSSSSDLMSTTTTNITPALPSTVFDMPSLDFATLTEDAASCSNKDVSSDFDMDCFNLLI